ncbi:MAG: ParA family protein [Myxococcota bacterium]
MTTEGTRGSMSRCDVCGDAFTPRFRYQVRDEGGRFVYVCSTPCQRRHVLGSGDARCAACDEPVEVTHPWQVIASQGAPRYFCSLAHRAEVLARSAPPPRGRRARRIAVFNHKGGTGKTTTSVNLAAGLAETGQRVLLVDADGQGNVGASLGIRGERTLYHVLVNGRAATDCAVPVRPNLDVITSDASLAAAELYLAGQPNRGRVLRERLGETVRRYDVVILDCAPALSLMNQNALVFADGVLVPVGCDYLSLVGVKQVLRTIGEVRRLLRHEVELLGVLPTFYDARINIAREALAALEGHFGDRCFTPVRINTRLREAPQHKKTIFELAPDSHGAEDYQRLVDRLLGQRAEGRLEAVA